VGFKSLNPFDGNLINEFEYWDNSQIDDAIGKCSASRELWGKSPLLSRTKSLQKARDILIRDKEKLALLITNEMGKILSESVAEIEKCITLIEFYVENAKDFLADEYIDSDATTSFISYEPLGIVYAVMPWNFPFWQVFRFAVPALISGNSVLMKHASNVPLCALAIEGVFAEAIDEEGVFISLMIAPESSEYIISNPNVNALTFTGSNHAGSILASLAGKYTKKSVLELGGSDPFIVLEDCNLKTAIRFAIISRFLNAGQSCIAAKRFIVVDSIADRFISGFKIQIDELKLGDPQAPETTLAPMSRPDLRDELHHQVSKSISMGAVAVTGCDIEENSFAGYQPSILDKVVAGMPAYEEELFGPVAAIIRVKDNSEALNVANDTKFGLGASVWTEHADSAMFFAKNLKAGCCFVNGMVKSDPKLPFGGIKISGYGKELSKLGMLEFVNAKTIWIK